MKRVLFGIITLLAAAACTVREPEMVSGPASGGETPEKFIPGTVTVEFTDDIVSVLEGNSGIQTKSPGVDALFESMGVIAAERVFPHAGEYEERTRREGLHRFYSLTFSEDYPVSKAVVNLKDLPGVISATPSRPIKKRAVFNDPYLSKQWHYINSKYSNADINVKEVWENYTKGSNNVTVCVVDEPVDPSHADLKGNLWKDASGHTGYNFARSSYDLSIRATYNGDIGHGTHVGGTVSAVNNNSLGVCGVAGGDYVAGQQGVLLQSCAIFSGTSTASDAKTANAIKWGADHGAVISQNSWGLYADENGDGRISSSELAEYRSLTIDDYPDLKAAIDYFIKYAGCDNNGNQLADSPMKGGLVFFAAGNENINWDPYAAYEPVIAVGAFRETGAKASYSNYGTWVDIAAPGGEGTSSSNAIWSTLPTAIASSGYGDEDWAGTSMACPHASGVAALIVSYYGGQGFTNDKAKDILFAGLGSTIGGSSPVGKKLDALASFQYGGVVGNVPLSLDAESVTVRAHETKTVNLKIKPVGSSYTLDVQAGSDFLAIDKTTGVITIKGRNQAEAKYKAVFTLHEAGQEDYSVELEYTLLPNHAPKAAKTYSDLLLEETGKTQTLSAASDLSRLFQDEDGEALNVKMEVGEPSVASITHEGATLKVTSLDFGIATVTITATDHFGETAQISFRVLVKDGQKGTEMYPETTTDEVTLWPSDTAVKKYYVDVYSESGALVLCLECTCSIYNPLNLQITSLAPGVYTAVITDVETGEKTSTKFIKF